MAVFRIVFGTRVLGRVALLLVAICFFVTNVAHAASHDHSLFSTVSGEQTFWENTSHSDIDAERHLSEARHCHGCFLSLLPQIEQLEHIFKRSQLFYSPLPTSEAYVLRSFDAPPPK
ncbi:MAG: hypothetical protein K2P86_00970 [Xanthobacteraceae bacterium]|nr:hypothetical protein [Xanthobacteraceae bacterium]